jgi:hypothetical protein
MAPPSPAELEKKVATDGQILGADASGAGKLPNNVPARAPQERHRSLPPIHLTVQRSTLGCLKTQHPANEDAGEIRWPAIRRLTRAEALAA